MHLWIAITAGSRKTESVNYLCNVEEILFLFMFGVMNKKSGKFRNIKQREKQWEPRGSGEGMKIFIIRVTGALKTKIERIKDPWIWFLNGLKFPRYVLEVADDCDRGEYRKGSIGERKSNSVSSLLGSRAFREVPATKARRMEFLRGIPFYTAVAASQTIRFRSRRFILSSTRTNNFLRSPATYHRVKHRNLSSETCHIANVQFVLVTWKNLSFFFQLR